MLLLMRPAHTNSNAHPIKATNKASIWRFLFLDNLLLSLAADQFNIQMFRCCCCFWSVFTSVQKFLRRLSFDTFTDRKKSPNEILLNLEVNADTAYSIFSSICLSKSPLTIIHYYYCMISIDLNETQLMPNATEVME